MQRHSLVGSRHPSAAKQNILSMYVLNGTGFERIYQNFETLFSLCVFKVDKKNISRLSNINHTECTKGYKKIFNSDSSETHAPCEISGRGGEGARGVGALAAGDLGRVGDEAAAVRPLRGGLG